MHGSVYAAALAEGLDLPDRLRLAAAAGALKAANRGGEGGVPRRDQIERLAGEANDPTD